MKVYYKTINDGEDLGYHGFKNDYRITYKLFDEKTIFCCDSMKESFEDGYPISFGEKDTSLNTNNKVCIYWYSYGYDEYNIDYCPWCGEKIECIEDKRVLIKKKKKVVKVPAHEKVVEKEYEVEI